MLSTTAQNEEFGQETAADLAPPVSSGSTGRGGVAGNGVGTDQSVPSPVLRWPEPSAITHVGPRVHDTAGSTGAVTGPVDGSG